MTIQGLHHITLVCSNAQQTVNFYTQVLLGQRLVKKTVNLRPIPATPWRAREVA